MHMHLSTVLNSRACCSTMGEDLCSLRFLVFGTVYYASVRVGADPEHLLSEPMVELGDRRLRCWSKEPHRCAYRPQVWGNDDLVASKCLPMCHQQEQGTERK